MRFCKCGESFAMPIQFYEHVCEYKDYREWGYRKEKG